MSKSSLNMLLTLIFLTIVLILIILVIKDNYDNFVKKLNENKLDKEYKKEMKVKDKYLIDNRNRMYKVEGNGINLTIDASNSYNNPYDSMFTKINDYKPIREMPKKPNKVLNTIINVIVFVVLLCGLSIGIYLRVNNSVLDFGNKAYITIQSGSMEAKNEVNTYLEDYDNQIKTFSLIGLDKVDESTSISLYDICAYKDKLSGKIIVHRIIKVEERSDDVYYTFRGDNNDSSDYYLIKRSEVLYKYNGYISYPLGLIVSYINSYVGVAVLLYVIISLSCLDYSFNKKEKLYYKNIKGVTSRFNKEEYDALGDTKVITIKRS